MSLFGESPPKARQTKSSLFDEPKAESGSGLFNDDSGDANASPWDFPTPKKAARRNLVKSLLQDTEVPELYVDAFDALRAGGSASENGVALDAATRLVKESKIDSSEQQKIIQIVGGGAGGLSRSEFNVLLALIGLAQEEDGHDENRDRDAGRRRRLYRLSRPAGRDAQRRDRRCRREVVVRRAALINEAVTHALPGLQSWRRLSSAVMA